MVLFRRKWEVLSNICLKKCELFLTRDILPATSENLPATRDPRRFDSHAIFGLPLLPLSSSAPTPPRRCWAARPYSHWHTQFAQFLFRFGHRQTDIFVIICSDFQEALSLLVYRNLWYMDAQVCFLKVLFKIWIDHFFQDQHWDQFGCTFETGLITFSMLAESLRSFDLSRKIEGDSVRRVIDQILGSYLLADMGLAFTKSFAWLVCRKVGLFTFLLGRKQSKYAIDKLRERLP